jgi:hypothetical protein
MNQQTRSEIRYLRGLIYMADDMIYSFDVSLAHKAQIREDNLILEEQILSLEKDEEMIRVNRDCEINLFLGDLRGDKRDLV